MAFCNKKKTYEHVKYCMNYLRKHMRNVHGKEKLSGQFLNNLGILHP